MGIATHVVMNRHDVGNLRFDKPSTLSISL